MLTGYRSIELFQNPMLLVASALYPYVKGTSYGGLTGMPHAFVRYIQCLLQPNDLLLSGNSKKDCLPGTILSTAMCLTWLGGQLYGNRYYAHAGGGGFYCEIRIYPDKEVGSVIFFNGTSMPDERFLDKADRFYL